MSSRSTKSLCGQPNPSCGSGSAFVFLDILYYFWFMCLYSLVGEKRQSTKDFSCWQPADSLMAVESSFYQPSNKKLEPFVTPAAWCFDCVLRPCVSLPISLQAWMQEPLRLQKSRLCRVPLPVFWESSPGVKVLQNFVLEFVFIIHALQSVGLPVSLCTSTSQSSLVCVSLHGTLKLGTLPLKPISNTNSVSC